MNMQKLFIQLVNLTDVVTDLTSCARPKDASSSLRVGRSRPVERLRVVLLWYIEQSCRCLRSPLTYSFWYPSPCCSAPTLTPHSRKPRKISVAYVWPMTEQIGMQLIFYISIPRRNIRRRIQTALTKLQLYFLPRPGCRSLQAGTTQIQKREDEWPPYTWSTRCRVSAPSGNFLSSKHQAKKQHVPSI